MDFIPSWKFDYVCGHGADAVNGLGSMISSAGPSESDEARQATFVLYLPCKTLLCAI